MSTSFQRIRFPLYRLPPCQYYRNKLPFNYINRTTLSEISHDQNFNLIFRISPSISLSYRTFSSSSSHPLFRLSPQRKIAFWGWSRNIYPRIFNRWEYKRHTWKQYFGGCTIAFVLNLVTMAIVVPYFRWDGEDTEKYDRYIGRKMPTEHERLQYFAECAEVWDNDMDQREHFIGIFNSREQVASQAKGDILEVACGTGRNYHGFVRNQFRITSLTMQDCIPQLVDIARNKLGEQNFSNDFPVRFDIGDAHELPYPDCSFDSVVMVFAISSIERPEQALAEANRVLKPTGRIYFLDRGLNRYGLLRWLEEYMNLGKTGFEWDSGQYIRRPLLKYFNQLKMPVISYNTTMLGYMWAITAGKSQYLEARRRATIEQMRLENEDFASDEVQDTESESLHIGKNTHFK